MPDLYTQVLPAVNGVAYLGGAIVSVVRLLLMPASTSRPAAVAYGLMTIVWAWIGAGYILLLALPAFGVPELAVMNRPVVWLTSVPAWAGFFLVDPRRDREAEKRQAELDALGRRLDSLDPPSSDEC